MKTRLVCLGNITVDDVVLPDGSETENCLGGDALYAALGARLFEPATEMVAPVGVDLPAVVMDRIVATGLSVDGLALRDLPTLRNRVVYDGKGDRTWTLAATETEFHTLSPRPDDIPDSFAEAEA